VGSRNDNGGDWSAEGGSDDLPDLPEEWGVIVIPDDLSELSDEVEAVRAELRHERGRSRWHRFARRPAVRRARRLVAACLKAPVLIISMAIVVTIASLFASAWPGPPRTPATQRTSGTQTTERSTTLPALDLVNADGQTVALRQNLPAVLLVTDGCDCAALIADTTAAVKPGIAVVTITTATASSAGTPPTGAAPQAQGKTVLALRDPAGELRRDLGLGTPDGTAAALLVNQAGSIVRQVLRTRTVDTFRADLARL